MRTKIHLMLAIALILPGGTALAQDAAPKAELFGGFSYMRTAAHNNVNGWNAQAAFNVNRWFGIAADFAGHYQTLNNNTGEPGSSVHTFLFGPQLSDRAGRITGFAHALFGGARIGDNFRLFGQRVPGQGTSFAMALGGGIDANVDETFAVRIFQADYLRMSATSPFTNESEGRNNFRLSVGVVFKIK